MLSIDIQLLPSLTLFSFIQENAIPECSVEWVADETSAGGPYNILITLPKAQPRLYAVILAVTDRAGNVGYARRLVMFDNSSSVGIMKNNPLTVTTAYLRCVYLFQVAVRNTVCNCYQSIECGVFPGKNNNIINA